MMSPRRRNVRFGLATLVTTLLLAAAWAPTSTAGSASNPEVSDASGDVSPSAFAANTPENASLFQNLTTYDVVRAWIGLETLDAFWLFIQVRDLPDGWGVPVQPPSESPFGPNISYAGTSLVANFTVAGITYQAVAKLAMPRPGEILDNYTLWRGNQSGTISGTYNTTQDWVAMLLPKEAFGGIPDNAVLSKFWVQGRFLDLPMDYAPNARDVDTGSLDPLKLAERLAQGRVVEPRYGRDYVFGQYYRSPPGGPPPGAMVPGLALELQGASQQQVDPGVPAVYEFRVVNTGNRADTVLLALSSAEPGWSHQLSESQVALEAGEGRLVWLTVSGSAGAVSPHRSLVDADSMAGASQAMSVLTFLKEPRVDPGTTGSPGPGDPGFSPTGGNGADTPGFTFAWAVAAVLAFALARRIRRA